MSDIKEKVGLYFKAAQQAATGKGYRPEQIDTFVEETMTLINEYGIEQEKVGHVHAAKALKHQAILLGGTPDYMLKQFDVHIERHVPKKQSNDR